MKNKLLLILIALLVYPVMPQTGGNLLIIGGGLIPDYVIEKFVELAGGKKSNFLIIPLASGEPAAAAASFSKKLELAGCSNIRVLYSSKQQADNDTNLAKLKNVTGVFFTGGDQSKLTSAIAGTKLLEGIKTIYRNGGVIGGTSAGAAVMSSVMITGKELVNYDSSYNEYNSIIKNNIETAKGFGFLENAIVDQHFIKRKRLTRLISITLDNPGLTGIGIDESTAIIVKNGNYFDVLGESLVIVFEARQCGDISSDKYGHQAAKNIKMHLLKSGDSYHFQQNGYPAEKSDK